MSYKIEKVETKNLELDWRNPRLAEFSLNANTPPEEVFKILWEAMALEELITSIVTNGFFETEPLMIIEENSKLVAIEGNRRLAAVKIILDPDLIEKKLPQEILTKITPNLTTSLKKLPVIKVNDRKEAWRFIGFKHINGPAKWNSFAKAQHIVDVHRNYNISLSEIALQVGDTHKTVFKLFQGMMVIEQAEKEKIFNREDIKKSRLYFSHLYTALQYEGVKKFISLENSFESKRPVPEANLSCLKELLIWLFGSKKEDIEPIIKSQNPDLKNLDNVLQNREAIYALRKNGNLSLAHELSRPKDSLFEESLFAAKREIQNAWSYLTEGYKGGTDDLKTAGTIAEIADLLYSKMEELSNKNKRQKKDRVTE